MSIGTLYREKIITNLCAEIKQSKGAFFVGFPKILTTDINRFRASVTDSNGKIVLTKNSLIRKAFEFEKQPLPEQYTEGQTAVVFVHDDPVSICKLLFGMQKEKEVFSIKGGIIDNSFLDTAKLQSMSKLPSKEILRAMTVGAIAAPLTQLVGGLNQMIAKCVWVIDAIKKQKEK